jgi:alpha-1,3-rhamnosyl/mannosyltransferase
MTPATGAAPLRVGIDATAAGIAGAAASGVYQYLYQLLRELLPLSPASRFRLLFALPHPRHGASIRAFAAALDAPNASVHRAPLPARHLLRWRVPVDLITGRLDVFHAPAHLGYVCRGCPVVVTVHDLAYLRDRGGATPPAGLGAVALSAWQTRRRFFAEMSAHMAQSVARATRVIAVSQATADDLVARLGVERARVDVVHLGLRPGLARPDERRTREVLDRLGIDPGYLLYVGLLDPNKNLPTLIEGYAAYRARGGRSSLLVAGHSDFHGESLRALCARLGVASHVRFPGFVADADLPALYAGASVLAMPSPLEGFGLPAIEAMACGTPVIGADAGALPEVIGAAGLLVAHGDPQAFAGAFLRIEQDAQLRTRLRDAGMQRAGCFSWRRAALETLGVYRRAVAGSGAALARSGAGLAA